MTTELIDNEFIVDDGIHPLERLGFKIVKSDESRIWMGRSNMYVESKSFQRNDMQLGEWNIALEARKGEIGVILFNRINGTIILPVEYSGINGLIKSKRAFWLFRRPKNKMDKYYSVQPAIHSTELINLLLELCESNIEIKIENRLINFEFNFDNFENHYYELIVDVLSLVPRW